MTRLSRLVVAGFAHHVVARVVTGGRAFYDDADRLSFMQALQRSGVEQHVAIHAFVLLDGEVQLLMTPLEDEGIGRMMQALARFYVPSFNRRHGRAGALWQGRFRAAPVGGADALLSCMLYVEQAPLRVGWDRSPSAYGWSSAAAHSGVSASQFLAQVPSGSGYWQLGNTPFERDAAYLLLLDHPMSSQQVEEIERSTPKGWAIGSGEFLARLQTATERRISGKPRGRPRRSAS